MDIRQIFKPAKPSKVSFQVGQCVKFSGEVYVVVYHEGLEYFIFDYISKQRLVVQQHELSDTGYSLCYVS